MSKLFSSFLATLFLPAYLFAVCDAEFTSDAVNDTICLGAVITFTDQSILSGNLTVTQWNFGDQSPIANGVSVAHIYTTTGTFTVGHTVADDNTCTGAFISHTIVVIPPPSLQTWGLDATCFDFEDGQAYVFINGDHNNYIIEWDDNLNQDNDTAFGLEAGDYSVTVSDLFGCSVDGNTVDVNEPAELVVDAGEDIFICIGDNPIQINSFAEGGTDDYTYSWEPGTIAGLDDPTSDAPVLTPNNNSFGEFYVTVTDENGCIASDYVEVKMTLAKISGTVYEGLGTANTLHGMAYLIKVDAPDQQWIFLDSAILGNGTYEFDSVPLVDVIILARQQMAPFTVIPTYYGDTADWEGATHISPNCGDSLFGKDIHCILPTPQDGTCEFNGTVFLVLTGKTLSGDPIPFIDVVVKKTPPGNAIAYTQTGTGPNIGQFTFTGMEASLDSSYSFLVNIPGLTMMENYSIEVDIDDLEYNNLNFWVVINTITGAGGIYTEDPIGIEPLQREREEMLAYPNPFNTQCEFRFPNESNGAFSFMLFDLTGKLITQADNLLGNSYVFKTETLEQGIYFAEVRTAENVFRSRVMKK